MDEERSIAWARQRQADGCDDDVDRWRLKAAERQAQRVTKDAPIDTVFVHDESADVVRGIYEDTAEAIGILADDFRKEIDDLRVEVAELRGELRGMREDRCNNNVVDVPRSAWRHRA
jgi:hypothetical protein